MSDSIAAELLVGGEVIDTLAWYSIVKNAKTPYDDTEWGG